MAREQVERGYEWRTGKFHDDLRSRFGLEGEEAHATLRRLLGEIPPECYEPPFKLEEPPGCPYVFRSAVLGCELYFKFQILGTVRKPRVLFWSCHPPRHGMRREKQ